MADYERCGTEPIAERTARCTCGHSIATHGSAGKMCCMCDCLQFVLYTPLPKSVVEPNHEVIADVSVERRVSLTEGRLNLLRLSKFKCCEPDCNFFDENFKEHTLQTGHKYSKAVYRTV